MWWVVQKNHEDICVRSSDLSILVSEGSGVMEAEYHPCLSLFLVVVDCEELMHHDLKHKWSLGFEI